MDLNRGVKNDGTRGKLQLADFIDIEMGYVVRIKGVEIYFQNSDQAIERGRGSRFAIRQRQARREEFAHPRLPLDCMSSRVLPNRHL
mgnify:CR=1 FL=1